MRTLASSVVSGACYNVMIIFQVDLIVETKVNGILMQSPGLYATYLAPGWCGSRGSGNEITLNKRGGAAAAGL